MAHRLTLKELFALRSAYGTHIEFRTRFNYPILSFRTYVELHDHWYYDA